MLGRMNALAEHFQLLDNDRDIDDVGPYLPLTVLPPWEHDESLWGPPSVRRVRGGLQLWVVLTPPEQGEEWRPYYDKPFARLPETMRGIAKGVEIDWRTMMKLRVEPDGYCYVEPVDG